MMEGNGKLQILLRKKFNETDLNQFIGERNTLLIHVGNVPTCIKEGRLDMRGYRIKKKSK